MLFLILNNIYYIHMKKANKENKKSVEINKIKK